MRAIAGIGAAAVTGWVLLGAPALEGAKGRSPFAASAIAATCVTDCENPSPHGSFLEGMGALVAGALAPARIPPRYRELWISKENLRRLARRHGTHALKITETKVFIRRDGKWIPVLSL